MTLCSCPCAPRALPPLRCTSSHFPSYLRLFFASLSGFSTPGGFSPVQGFVLGGHLGCCSESPVQLDRHCLHPPACILRQMVVRSARLVALFSSFPESVPRLSFMKPQLRRGRAGSTAHLCATTGCFRVTDAPPVFCYLYLPPVTPS